MLPLFFSCAWRRARRTGSTSCEGDFAILTAVLLRCPYAKDPPVLTLPEEAGPADERRTANACSPYLLFVRAGLDIDAARAPAPSDYNYTTIDYPGSFNSGVFGINKAGQMSGTYFGNDALAHAFICTKGKFSRLDFPEAARTFGFGLNEAAWVVGYYGDADNILRVFFNSLENLYVQLKCVDLVG